MPFSRQPISFSVTVTTFPLGAVQIAAASGNAYAMLELIVFGVSVRKLPDKVVLIALLSPDLCDRGFVEREAGRK